MTSTTLETCRFAIALRRAMRRHCNQGVPMFRRYLAPSSISVFKESRLWANLCADPELQPEIRDHAITVYYRGRALLRNLMVSQGTLTAEVHRKYLPMSSVKGRQYAQLSGSVDRGLSFVDPPAPLSLGLGDLSVLNAYKKAMALISPPEGNLIQQICKRRDNQIVDQEIAFQETGEPRDKIDLCHFDDGLGKLIFVEVKRIEDVRLFGRLDLPKVIRQLRAYCVRLRRNQRSILELYRQVVGWKRELGLGDRILKVPRDGPNDLLEKPMLVIGNCTDADVREILDGGPGVESKRNWVPLKEGLRDVAAGLLLCGSKGRRLNLVKGHQTIVFA